MGRRGGIPRQLPGRAAAEGAGVHLKNLYNDYVYFWRWALWKVLEWKRAGTGLVSFITASSYLRGPGFVGDARVDAPETLDELWIIDLKGDNLGARKTENVFAIQTPGRRDCDWCSVRASPATRRAGGEWATRGSRAPGEEKTFAALAQIRVVRGPGLVRVPHGLGRRPSCRGEPRATTGRGRCSPGSVPVATARGKGGPHLADLSRSSDTR